MVSVVPFLPSFRWYASLLQFRRDNLMEAEAIASANKALHMAGKGFARCSIRERDKERSLAVAIAGGNASLKRVNHIPSATLSEHGDWRHNHLKTFEAIYGKMPFFTEVYPLLKNCYEEMYEESLASFNRRLHEALLSILLPSPDSLHHHLPEIARERGLELADAIHPDLSLLDSIMCFGPETLLPLLVWKEK